MRKAAQGWSSLRKHVEIRAYFLALAYHYPHANSVYQLLQNDLPTEERSFDPAQIAQHRDAWLDGDNWQQLVINLPTILVTPFYWPNPAAPPVPAVSPPQQSAMPWWPSSSYTSSSLVFILR
nr:unnamed protein product [Digitaria exilis]